MHYTTATQISQQVKQKSNTSLNEAEIFTTESTMKRQQSSLAKITAQLCNKNCKWEKVTYNSITVTLYILLLKKVCTTPVVTDLQSETFWCMEAIGGKCQTTEMMTGI